MVNKQDYRNGAQSTISVSFKTIIVLTSKGGQAVLRARARLVLQVQVRVLFGMLKVLWRLLVVLLWRCRQGAVVGTQHPQQHPVWCGSLACLAQGSLHDSLEHCLVNGGFPLLWC